MAPRRRPTSTSASSSAADKQTIYVKTFGSSHNQFPLKEFSVLPVSYHALAYGLFASSIAPFGGFSASGFKRAFKIKDFGDSIPGHGGITNRMDCQMVMAVFSYIYYQSFIVNQSNSVESFLDQILGVLTFEEQIALYMQLGEILNKREDHQIS